MSSRQSPRYLSDILELIPRHRTNAQFSPDVFDLPIGHNSTGGVFSILGEDRRKHMALFGKSGTGKTTLLRNMITLDMQAGLGLTVIDPHGSLVRDVLELIPKHRIGDPCRAPREPW